MSDHISVQSPPVIRLRGVRVYNLKEIDLDLPLNQLTVISGVSGSGKTSLACDTLFAESQRRFTETASPQIRQILGGVAKPDADLIEQIPPAIVLRDNSHTGNESGTVASVTGLDAYLAMLFTRLGNIVCPQCDIPVMAYNAEAVTQVIQSWPSDLRFQICYLLPEFSDPESSQQNERLINLDSGSPVGAGQLVILDRLKTGKTSDGRLSESLEQAMSLSGGSVVILRQPGSKEPAGNENETQSDSPLVVIDGKDWQWFQYHNSLTCGGCQHEFCVPHPQLFSSHSSLGACPDCAGSGKKIQFEFTKIIPDETLSLIEGAITLFTKAKYKKLQDSVLNEAAALQLPIDQSVLAWSEVQRNQLWLGKPASGLKGVLSIMEEEFLDNPRYPTANFRHRWMSESKCDSCNGLKMRFEALAVKLQGRNFLECLSGNSRQMTDWILGVTQEIRTDGLISCENILGEIKNRLQKLEQLGLEYLSLGRKWNTFSAGERKRVQIAGVLSVGLVNTLVVLDEPARSLHLLEQKKVIDALQEMKRQGNTILIVENSNLFQQQADYNVVLGPGAGVEGGKVIYSGAEFVVQNEDEVPVTEEGEFHSAFPMSYLKIEGARTLCLNKVNVQIPLHQLSVVCGVSGSGKKSLVYHTLYPAIQQQLGESIEQSVIPLYDSISIDEPCSQVIWMDSFLRSANSRSILATSLKIFPVIREEFANTVLARSRNYEATDFSFNTAEGGRCEECSGRGTLEIDMHFMENLFVPCSSCQGTRYRPDILEVRFRGLNINEVLSLSVKAAFEYFRKMPAVQKKLQVLMELGLGYLELGRPLSTLSHGERQRLKLTEFLSQRAQGHTIYLLDEPSAGLHPSEIVRLRNCFQRLLEVGHTVIVIDHHPQLIRSADYLIELGTGAGNQEGNLLAQGTPREVLASSMSDLGPLISPRI